MSKRKAPQPQKVTLESEVALQVFRNLLDVGKRIATVLEQNSSTMLAQADTIEQLVRDTSRDRVERRS